jgi:hypothetical protein
LPRIVEDLWLDYIEPGKITFAIQSNFNVPGGTPATVIARAQLEGLPADKVVLYTEPLDSSSYCDLVVNSDIILLPYDKQAYYAGSSGILAEALAAGVPVIVPEGIWMAKQFAEETRRHHEGLRESMRTLDTLYPNQLRWQRDGNVRVKLTPDGLLSLGAGSSGPFTKLRIPEATDFLLISVGPTLCEVGNPIYVYMDQMDRTRDSLKRQTYSLCPSTEDRRTLLIPLEPGTRLAYTQLSKSTPNCPGEIRELRFDFLAKHEADDACPLGAVGLVYRDPEEITGLLREMIENYAHYRQTAQAFSARWFPRHKAGELVAEVRRAA